jgi:nitroimidazol reductase NimA-like FMN-containing flavoprotein (pyridoxamine 5'-phosphate oxidase superfamily)
MDEGYRNPGEWWYHVSSVVCFGRASLVTDEQCRHDALLALGRKYFPPETDIEADIDKNGHRVNLIELRVEHLTGKLVQEK